MSLVVFRRLLAMMAGAFVLQTVAQDQMPPPPAPPPFPGMPAAAEVDPAKVLEALPEVLASYKPDQKFTRADLVKEIGPMLPMAAMKWSRMTPEQVKDELREAVPMLLNRVFILELVNEAGIKADPTKVDADLAEFAKQIGGEDRLKMVMEQRGITRDMMIQQQMIAQFVETKVMPDIKVERAEVAAFYQENQAEFSENAQVRASHILVKVERDADAATHAKAKAKAEGLLAQVKQGGDFAELAKANSDCPSKAQGGDLDYFGEDDMVPEFSAAAFKMKKDDISEVVKTDFGYHVIKVTDSKPAKVQPLDEELSTEISEAIRREKVQGVLEARLKKMQTDKEVKLLF